jgi:quinol monooxygenase YgiN
MKTDTCCTLVPYFEVNADKLNEFKALTKTFVEQTKSETGCLFYAFSFSGLVAHCREGYVDAAALLAHLDNVGTLLQQALTMSKLFRLEVHGSLTELDKLRAPLAGLNPEWFVLEEGGFRS